MDNIRYKYEVTPSNETLVTSGDLKEIMTYITRQAQIIYPRLRDRSPEAAEFFRMGLAAVFADPRSPVWHGTGRIDNGIDLLVIKEKHAGGVTHESHLQKAG